MGPPQFVMMRSEREERRGEALPNTKNLKIRVYRILIVRKGWKERER